MRVEKLRHGRGVRAIAEHADLDRGNLHVLYQNIQLRAQRGGGREVQILDALRGLHCQRGDGPDAVAAVRRERLQVRRGPGAAGWIKASDGQQNRRGGVRMAIVIAHYARVRSFLAYLFWLPRSSARVKRKLPATLCASTHRASRQTRMYADFFLQRKKKFWEKVGADRVRSARKLESGDG